MLMFFSGVTKAKKPVVGARFTCHVCQEVFSRAGGCKLHMKIMHGIDSSR